MTLKWIAERLNYRRQGKEKDKDMFAQHN